MLNIRGSHLDKAAATRREQLSHMSRIGMTDESSNDRTHDSSPAQLDSILSLTQSLRKMDKSQVMLARSTKVKISSHRLSPVYVLRLLSDPGDDC